MQKHELRTILENLPSDRRRKIRQTGENYFQISCLMSPWRHLRGQDRRPSMVVSFDHDGPSMASCFTCGYKRPLFRLLLWLNSKLGPGSGMAQLALDARDAEQRNQKMSFGPKKGREIKLVDYTSEYKALLKNVWSSEATALLHSKGVRLDTAVNKFFCAFAPKGHWDEGMGVNWDTGEPNVLMTDCILFPILICCNEQETVTIAGALARPIDPSSYLKYFSVYSYQGFFHLFGQQQLHHIKGEPVILVEGPFDAMHLHQEGYWSVALNGLYLGKHKADKIAKARPSRVIVLLDPDKAGRQATVKVVKELTSVGIVPIVHQLDRDPKYYTRHELQNEITALNNK
jgi:5S rRNA maturation endonuclease (ribonuclease M5)